VTGVAVAAVACIAAATWYLALPRWRPELRPGERYGIDVASHQGQIDWPAVAADHIGFAYVKATEGGDFVDGRFAYNWREAGRSGIDRGAYHFFTLCTPGAAQAENFLRVIPPTTASLAPAVDFELAGNCTRRPDDDAVRRQVQVFIDRVEQAWRRPVVLYVGDDWEARYPIRRRIGRPLWQRRILRRPDIPGWTMWQASGKAHVEGVPGLVDLDVERP